MPKSSAKARAAREREALKRGETKEVPMDHSVLADPTYTPEIDIDMAVPPTTVSMHVSSTSDIAEKRKLRRENADLLPERPVKISRTTAWRNRTGITMKARATNFQPSIASIFKVAPSQKALHEISLAREEQEEPEASPDSDIEILDQSNTVMELIIVDDDGSEDSLNTTMDSETCSPAPATVQSDHSTPEPGPSETCSPAPATPTAQSDHSTPEPGSTPDPGPTNIEVDSESDVPTASWSQTSAREIHQRLRQLIQQHRAKLRNGNVLKTQTTAANILIDLDALMQYNDLRFKLSNKRFDLQIELAKAPRNLKYSIKKRIAKIQPAIDASNIIALRCSRGPYFAMTLRKMARALLTSGRLPEKNQGKGAYHESWLKYPGVSSSLQEWVKGGLPVDEGGYLGNMRPAKLRHYVNNFLFPRLKIEDTISESTALRWLKCLGFKQSRVQKGIYVDGHERPDVVASRTEFINYMYSQVLPFSYTYEGADLVETSPTLSERDRIHYPIFHDETCVHANDLNNFVWMRDGEQPLRNKSRGRIVHISDFILEHCGRLSLNAAEISAQMKLPIRPLPPTASSNNPLGRTKRTAKEKNTKKSSQEGRTFTEQEYEWVPPPPPAPFQSYRLSNFDARRIIYPGANHDPWWDMPQLIVQTKNAIEIFETKYPNGIAVFIFDCSSAHEAYPADALLAHKMNRGPGGKQPAMRNTIIPSTGLPQSMVYPADYQGVDKEGVSLAGKPKGMEQVLRERNLLSLLEKKHGNKVVGVCGNCKKSQAAREAALKLAKSKEDELEPSNLPALAGRGISDLEDDDAYFPKDCCMQRVLSLEKDFREEKPLLQLIIEKSGHKCLFLPKFHCELNPIEMVWGQTKQRFREYADGTFPTAKTLVPECLNAVTTDNIRRYFRHCYRYMDAYKRGLNIKQAAYAVRKYSSHRRIPANIMMDINIINRGATG